MDAHDAVRLSTRRPPVAAQDPRGGPHTATALFHTTWPTFAALTQVSFCMVYMPVHHEGEVWNGAPEPTIPPQLQEPGTGVWMSETQAAMGKHTGDPNDQLPLEQIPLMLPVKPAAVFEVVTDAPSAAPGTG